ncbi:MAG TPA: ABC transporter permease [Acidimicrobiales bacterium]|nr:ABC transporter permease [Acidimicrobiales bacterium]
MTAVIERPPQTASPVRRATFGDALRSEWTKLRTVRSTFWSLAAAAALGIGLGALISWAGASRFHRDAGLHFNWNPTDHSLRSLTIAQLAFAVLGVLIISGEYSTGMIRTSLAAVAKRSRMLSAKLTVFTLLALIAGEAIALATFFLGQALIYGKAPSASIGYPHVARAVIGAGVYLALLALLGSAIATIVRHAAAGIAVIVAILFVLPGIAYALPTSWQQPIEEYWPTNAGQQFAIVMRDAHTLGPWQGFGVMAAFVAVVLVAAFVLLERRDA